MVLRFSRAPSLRQPQSPAPGPAAHRLGHKARQVAVELLPALPEQSQRSGGPSASRLLRPTPDPLGVGGCPLWGRKSRKEEGAPRSRTSTSGVGLTHREMEGRGQRGVGGEGRGVQARH